MDKMREVDKVILLLNGFSTNILDKAKDNQDEKMLKASIAIVKEKMTAFIEENKLGDLYWIDDAGGTAYPQMRKIK